MKLDKARAAVIGLTSFLLLGILSLVFWDFFRASFLVPIYYLLWLTGLLINSVSQKVYLAILIGACLVIGIQTIRAIQGWKPRMRPEYLRPEENSRLGQWVKLCRNLDASEFSRSNFGYEARKLILSILAFQEGIDGFEVERQISLGTIAVPPLIKQLIETRQLPGPAAKKRWLARWLERIGPRIRGEEPKLDARSRELVEEIVGFIETRLEIHHE